jgi:hypothetical protein
MDALEFIKAVTRMLKSGMIDCAIQKYISAQKKNDYEGMVKAAEQWAAEHPVKTRQSVFLEQYPETEIDKYGCLRLCPELVSADYRNRHGDCINRVCIDCRREFWMQEVEE